MASIDSERIHRIHNRVCEVRMNEQVGVKYMQAWEERIYDKEEARAKGVSVSDIARFMDEDESDIEKIADAVKEHPMADAEELYGVLFPEEEK